MRRIIEVLPCSIIDTGADAVVNASNPDAVLGGGVSRALFNECGGEVLQKEMREKLDDEFDGELGPEDCLLTSAGTSKKIRFVLHVPSVDYRDPGTSSAARVASSAEAALTRAVLLAEKVGPITVALPLLGAGSGGLSPPSRSRRWSTGCGACSTNSRTRRSRAWSSRSPSPTGSR